MSREIQTGDKVKDTVSGFEGIVVSKVEYLNGCVQFCVKAKLTTAQIKKGETKDGVYFDEEQLKYVGKGVNAVKKKTGGVMPDAPSDTYKG